jgi:chemotaxis protein CheY-P-specific phosphatase CheC
VESESVSKRDLFFKNLASTASEKINRAISELTGEKSLKEFCKVRYAEVDEKELVIDVNARCFGAYSRISQPIEGVAVVFFPERSTSKLLDLVKKRYGQKKDFSHEMENSALKEISNIIISTYLSELGNLLNTKISSSPPEISYFKTMTFSKDAPSKTPSKNSNLALNISSKTPFRTSNLVLMGKFSGFSGIVEGRLVLFFDSSSFDELLKTKSGR